MVFCRVGKRIPVAPGIPTHPAIPGKLCSHPAPGQDRDYDTGLVLEVSERPVGAGQFAAGIRFDYTVVPDNDQQDEEEDKPEGCVKPKAHLLLRKFLFWDFRALFRNITGIFGGFVSHYLYFTGHAIIVSHFLFLKTRVTRDN